MHPKAPFYYFISSVTFSFVMFLCLLFIMKSYQSDNIAALNEIKNQLSEISSMKEQVVSDIEVKINELEERNKNFLEDATSSVETTYQVYTSEYIKQMSDRAAIAQARLKEDPTLEKSNELFKDLMATTEIDNYEYGVGHNVIEKVEDDVEYQDFLNLRKKYGHSGLDSSDNRGLFKRFQKLRTRLKFLGMSDSEINEAINRK